MPPNGARQSAPSSEAPRDPDFSKEWAKQLASGPPPKLPKDPFEGL
ncbi:MAG: hypothetical protein QM784_16615 [Polyangiaceae bacterium]